ncbi:STAS domain-containing protein [Psychroserpens damuponensis]|uniref:STAS domain-containing protein n=1 Tax=Psychroserpens damuponensis TaxID=943936 RepID=UPI000693A19F|nr:STAS domain-containing protein [Psychroserpens damuponensis]
MALQILEQNGIFNLHGRLTTATSQSFLNHFKNIITSVNDVTINIDKVSEIDATGMSAIRVLYDNALQYNRNFFIIGNGCKEIYEEFRYTEEAA